MFGREIALSVLVIVVLVCYLACAAWLASSAYRASGDSAHGQRVAGISLGATAFLLHTVVLWQAWNTSPATAFTLAETASVIGWLVSAIALGLAWRRPRFAGISAILMVIAGVVAALTDEGARSFAAERYSWEITAHIALSTTAYALLTIAAALAIALARLDQRLRKRQPLGWLGILPSMEALDAGMFQAVGAGFALLTLALFSGFVFVENLFAQHLIHKTVLSCLAWVVFALLLLGRWRFGWRGRTAVRWVLSGFSLLVLAYFGAKLVLESILGRHWG